MEEGRNPAINLNYFTLLPVELKEYLFSFLTEDDLWTCLKVCKDWRKILNNYKKWEKICSRKQIDCDDYADGEDKSNDLLLCKSVTVWKQLSSSIKRWCSDSFIDYTIPYGLDYILARCRISAFNKQLAIITYTGKSSFNDILYVYDFRKNSVTVEKIVLSQLTLFFIRPLGVLINKTYVVISITNVIAVFKKNKNYTPHLAIAYAIGQPLNFTTQNIFNFLRSKFQLNAHFKLERLTKQYLWVTVITPGIMTTLVINLETFHWRRIDVVAEIVSGTKKSVALTTSCDIQVFSLNGDHQLSFNFRRKFKLTNDYLVAFDCNNHIITVFSMDGIKLRKTNYGSAYFELDPTRNLIYVCCHKPNGVIVNAVCLKTCIEMWSLVIDNIQLDDIVNLYFICNRFLIIDCEMCRFSDIRRAVNFAFIIDVEKKIMLYKSFLKGSTSYITDHIWVLEAEKQLNIQYY